MQPHESLPSTGQLCVCCGKLGGRIFALNAVLPSNAAPAPLPSKGQELQKEIGNSVGLGPSTQQKTDENPRSDSCLMPKQRTSTEMRVMGGGSEDERGG